MYCKSCGKQIDEDSKFCSFCGTKHIISIVSDQIHQEVSSKTVQKQTTSSPIEKKKIETKVIKEKYDLTYKKETIARRIGIIILLVNTIFLVFLKNIFTYYETVETANVILGTFMVFIRIIITIWVTNHIALRQNRNKTGWGVFTFLFPAIALIIIGSTRKLNKGEGNSNNSISISAGHSNTEQKQTIKFNENLNSIEDIIRELEKQKNN